ncbi:MAG: hypothetical protein HC923_02755 [Myxococcales bacterium]|nr:hypothetical protein [Myxococcales bacterium]
MRGTYRAHPESQFFRGHYPGHPIMPGVLLVEVMLQAGAYLMARGEPQGAMEDGIPRRGTHLRREAQASRGAGREPRCRGSARRADRRSREPERQSLRRR